MKKWIRLFLLMLSVLAVRCSKSNVEEVSTKKETQPVEIYLIRHGKTMFNTTGQVQGWTDSPLTEVGIEQAKQAGKGLSEIEFSHAYSSDMGRARHTAQYILEGNEHRTTKEINVTELIGLREWGYGGYEGRDDEELWTPLFEEKRIPFETDWSTWEELTKAMTDEEMANAIAANDKTGMAENYSDIVSRSKDAIEKIVKDTSEKGGGKVLAVSHGSEIPTILSIYTPNDYHGESINNCSLTILKYEKGQYSLETVGDTSYMEE